MGMMKYLARVGAVGGTARWAADTYKAYRLRHPASPEWPEDAIYRLMIATRYQVMPNAAVEQHLLGIDYAGRGLLGLVIEVLTCEADFAKNTHDYQDMFMSVIVEELQKKGLSRGVIFGKL